ncbi:MAG: SprT family zinc-dependent metalloprotease [Dehalococcoidia bacterium]
MSERGCVHFGSTTIEYAVIRSERRKKTVDITLDPYDGVMVAVPAAASAADVQAVVTRRAKWIVRKSKAGAIVPRPKQFVSGESIPYLGRQVRMFVHEGTDKRFNVSFDHWSFRVTVPAGVNGVERRDGIRRELTAWHRARAQARLEERVHRWAAILGCVEPRILTRSQRRRWGSCSPDGTIRFNWRIVMADPALIDYVVVHELLHLGTRSHSAGFWAQMRRAMPDYKRRQSRLRECGPYLSY